MQMPLPLPLMILARAATVNRVSYSVSGRHCSLSFPLRTLYRLPLTQVLFGVGFVSHVVQRFPPKLTLLSSSASSLVYCAHGSAGDASAAGGCAVPDYSTVR